MRELTKRTREELEREGWKESTLAGGQRLTRALEMYQEMGFEVYLEEVDLKDCAKCTTCYEQSNEKQYRVYSRSANPKGGSP